MAGKPAARQWDPTYKGGPITGGSPDVRINGEPAARQNDPTYKGGLIVQGSNSVFYNGKPAARQTDMSARGGQITSGSPNVFIGTHDGKACSVCPKGTAPDVPANTPNPVNLQLGAKVLLGKEELDFALPGALPLTWQRQYSSYVNAEHGAACGPLGHGWHLLNQITLETRENTILFFDDVGRTVTFEEPLGPLQERYSPSEKFWLLRGGQDKDGWPPDWSRRERFAHVPAELAADENCILAASGSADVLWVFTPDPDAPQPAKPDEDKIRKDITGQHPDKSSKEITALVIQALKAIPGQRWRL
ncbi:MAG: DUF6531 domain-containing protein, partial [Burkholderiaceae bacterium]|nr:DUF6531 domain-containing protein [Burkholderiaceae bacterium]